MCAEGASLGPVTPDQKLLPWASSGVGLASILCTVSSLFPSVEKNNWSVPVLGNTGACFRPLCFSSPFWMLSEVTDVECCPGHQGWRAFLGEG